METLLLPALYSSQSTEFHWKSFENTQTPCFGDLRLRFSYFSHLHSHLLLGQGAIHLRAPKLDLQILPDQKIRKSWLSKSGSLVSMPHDSSLEVSSNWPSLSNQGDGDIFGLQSQAFIKFDRKCRRQPQILIQLLEKSEMLIAQSLMSKQKLGP